MHGIVRIYIPIVGHCQKELRAQIYFVVCKLSTLSEYKVGKGIE